MEKRTKQSAFAGSSYNVCERIDATPRVVNEMEDYPSFLRVCLLASWSRPVQVRLEKFYTSHQPVEVRHRHIPVTETLLKDTIRKVFELSPEVAHVICKELVELALGVEFSSQVLGLIRQLDPLNSAVRKVLNRSGLANDERIDMCWALIESGFEAISSLVEKNDVNGVEDVGGGRNGHYEEMEQAQKRRKNGNSTSEPVLVLDDGEMLSDGELSGEVPGEEGSEECAVRVMKRRNSLGDHFEEDEEERASFGVVLQDRSHVLDQSKLDEVQGKVSEIKSRLDGELRQRVQETDISRVYYQVDGAKGQRIQVVNMINDDPFPSDFEWLAERIYSKTFPEHRKETDLLCACECQGQCLSDPNCTCRDENQFQSAPYDASGRLLWADNWLIHECSRHCPCGDSCGMRVTQLPPPVSLQLFRTEFKGWGARCCVPITKGTFLGEYLGELIDQVEAAKRSEACDSSYLFDLDWEYINLSGSDVHSEFKPSRDDIVTVDAFKFGGITRFFNHSCSPNLRVMSVANDTPNLKLVHLCFFAAREILPYEELCFNYSYSNGNADDGDGIKCACGAAGCKGIRF